MWQNCFLDVEQVTVTSDSLSYSATLMLGDSRKSYMKWLMLGFLLHQTWWFSVKQTLGLNKCLIHSVGPCVPHVIYFLWQIAICGTTKKIIQIFHFFKYLRDLSLIFFFRQYLHDMKLNCFFQSQAHYLALMGDF